MSKETMTRMDNEAARGSVRKFILSKDPNRAMQEMMDTIDALHAVFEEETNALIKADTRRFMDLQQRKISVTRQYQHGTEQFLSRKDEMKKAAPEKQRALKEKYLSFSDITQKNMHQLERMRGGINRLHDHIMKAARDNAGREGVNYSARGKLNAHSRRLSMGLNESA